MRSTLDACDSTVAAGARAVAGVTVAAVLISVGALALLARLTDWEPGARIFIATALLVVGLSLLAAAFPGGRTAKGGLIALGVVLSLALLIASTAPWHGMRGGIGDRTWAPTTAEGVRSSYEGGVGDIHLDLSRIDVGELDQPIRTTLQVGVGDVDILVPVDPDVRLEVDNGLGDVTVDLDEAGDGFYPGDGRGEWVDDGTAEIVLSVDAGLGDVEVSRG